MDIENGPSTEVVEAVVIDTDTGQSVVVDIPDTNGDTVLDTEIGAPVTEAVAIAEIHAERDVTIAAINADVAQAQIEAESERVEPWHVELEMMRTNITELTGQLTELAERVVQLALIPTPQSEPVIETIEELNLTPTSIEAENIETVTEVGNESEVAEPEPERPSVVHRRRAI